MSTKPIHNTDSSICNNLCDVDDDKTNEHDEEKQIADADSFHVHRANQIHIDHHQHNNQFSYVPSEEFKALYFIKIPDDFTQRIIPEAVRENIEDVKHFIIKSTAMVFACGNAVSFHTICGCTSVIFNYDFHDKKTGEILYCVADKNWNSKRTNNQYVMRNKLYTGQNIVQLSSKPVHLPKSSRHSNDTMVREMRMVRNILISSMAKVIKSKQLKWNEVPVYKQQKDFNKQRLTLGITKEALSQIPITEIVLIPIVMFGGNGCEYRVEYVQVLKVYNHINIGISYCYNACNHSVKVTGIHLNKSCILRQHQLISPNHDCHCLDAFECPINDVRVGNPDVDLNRFKDFRKRKTVEIQALRNKLNQSQAQIKQLQQNNINYNQRNTVSAVINDTTGQIVSCPYAMNAIRNINYLPDICNIHSGILFPIGSYNTAQPVLNVSNMWHHVVRYVDPTSIGTTPPVINCQWNGFLNGVVPQL